MNRALLAVDPQYDFIDGTLPVPGAAKAMDALAKSLPAAGYCLKIATCDWHPWNHCSFGEAGGRWPRHCVRHSQGAAIWQKLLSALNATPGPLHVFCKGTRPWREEYSIFQDESANLAIRGLLDKNGIDAIDICGLAGDVCVLNTLRDGAAILGADKFRLLQEFSPSLDGGASLANFCAAEAVCVR